MNKALPLTVIITSYSFFLCAQSSSTLMGARASALGYASACHTDVWSVFNNIAGLAKIKVAGVAFTYDAQPTFKPFNKAATVFAVPLKIGVAGMGVYRFGDNLYNEQILTAGFSSNFGLASLGAKINYIQYNAEGFGRKAVFSISLGGIAQLTPQLSVGAHIINLNQPKIADINGERIPTILVAGILFKPSDKTLIATELEKDLMYKPTWKTGLEYQVHQKFSIRSGFSIHPNAGFFGIGFRPRKFTLDYAFKYNADIGARHQASVGYNFNKPKK